MTTEVNPDSAPYLTANCYRARRQELVAKYTLEIQYLKSSIDFWQGVQDGDEKESDKKRKTMLLADMQMAMKTALRHWQSEWEEDLQELDRQAGPNAQVPFTFELGGAMSDVATTGIAAELMRNHGSLFVTAFTNPNIDFHEFVAMMLKMNPDRSDTLCRKTPSKE